MNKMKLWLVGAFLMKIILSLLMRMKMMIKMKKAWIMMHLMKRRSFLCLNSTRRSCIGILRHLMISRETLLLVSCNDWSNKKWMYNIIYRIKRMILSQFSRSWLSLREVLLIFMMRNNKNRWTKKRDYRLRMPLSKKKMIWMKWSISMMK